MEEPSMAVVVDELRTTLTSALERLSRVSAELPAVKDACNDCYSLYSSIEEIYALAIDAEKNTKKVSEAHERLQDCLSSAKQTLAELVQRADLHGKDIHSSRYALPHRRKIQTQFYLQKLQTIVGAINLAALVIALRLKQTRRSKLLVTRITDSSAGATDVKGLASTTTKESLRELLRPDRLALLNNEAQLCWHHHVKLIHGKAPVVSPMQLLDINVINWIFWNRPACARGTRPILVSHHSDIMQAARNGDVVKLSQILEANPDMRYCFTLMGLTPIFFAIEAGEFTAVECLIRHGVKVNDYCGRTRTVPLAAALEFRHLHLVDFFIEKGASLKFRNKNGWTPLFYLWYMEQRRGPVTEFLERLKRHNDWRYLHENVFDNEGYAVIHRAADFGSPTDLLTLIRFGVNPLQSTVRKKANRHGGDYASWTALQIVIQRGYLDSFETLFPIYLREKMGSEMPNEHGYTLLHLAVNYGHLDIARRLIEQGANIDARTTVSQSHDLDEYACGFTAYELAEDAGVYQQFCEIVRNHRKAEPSTAAWKSNNRCDGVLELHIQREGNEQLAEKRNHWLLELSIPEVDKLGSCRHSIIDSARDNESVDWALSKTYTHTAVSDHGSMHQGDVINVNRHYTINVYISVQNSQMNVGE